MHPDAQMWEAPPETGVCRNREGRAYSRWKAYPPRHSDDWKYYEAADVWLPGAAVISHFRKPHGLDGEPNEVAGTMGIELKAVAFDVPEEIKFSLEYTAPGTLIMDRTTCSSERPSLSY